MQSGDVKVVYGINSYNGVPCLINAIGMMISEVSVEPCSDEPMLVSAFDELCAEIQGKSFGLVDSLTAEILVRHFGKLKDQPAELEELPELPVGLVVPDPSYFGAE